MKYRTDVSSGVPRSSLTGLTYVVAVYFLVNLAIWLLVDESIRYLHAGDGSSWYYPVVAFFEHGTFTTPLAPDVPDVYRPPMFILFGAAMSHLWGSPSPGCIAFGQLGLLLVSGILFRDTVDDWLPGRGNLGMAFLILNPNVLSTAQFTQSDTLFLFFVTFAFWAVMRFARGSHQWRYALAVGVALALACLTRPTTQFLLIILPIAFPLLLALNRDTARWRIGALQGATATLLAVLLVLPWMSFVKEVDGRYGLSDGDSRHRFLWDQIVMVEAQSQGVSYHAAEDRINEIEREIAEKHGETWLELNKAERYHILLDYGYARLLSYPIADLGTAYVRAWIQFFGGAGSGRWHNLLQIGSGDMERIWFATSQTDVLGMAREFVEQAPIGALAISAVCMLFVLLTRIVGALGLIAMAQRHDWSAMLVVLSLIAYFALVHLFVGNSRYRVVAEPQLMFLTIYGLDAILRRFSVSRGSDQIRH